jgi:hypothetical protein
VTRNEVIEDFVLLVDGWLTPDEIEFKKAVGIVARLYLWLCGNDDSPS